jgi:fluoride exporter
VKVLAAVAAGGVLGAEARFEVGRLLVHAPGEWPWATLLVNASGCVLIGVLMVVLGELGGGHPLARPFLGVGVLGGYTTFSTYAVEVLQLHDAGRTAEALGYLAVTPVVAVVACAAGTAATRILWRRFPRSRTARR